MAIVSSIYKKSGLFYAHLIVSILYFCPPIICLKALGRSVFQNPIWFIYTRLGSGDTTIQLGGSRQPSKRTMAKKSINVQGLEIVIIEQDSSDLISLTDIAKHSSDEPRFVIRNWLSTQNTINYLGEWESLHNPGFNRAGFRTFRDEFFERPFSLTPSRWIELTQAKGITSKAGRYGGTYAHQDIAINFCYWINPVFQIYLIKEFQRLKEEEAARLGESWSIQRTITKANHYLQTASVREHLVPLMQWNTKFEGLHQASEADLLNLIVFGMTAKEWRSANPEKKGNIRDHATKLELVVLNNLQAINAMLIEDKMGKKQRADKLLRVATTEMQTLFQVKPIEDLKKLKG